MIIRHLGHQRERLGLLPRVGMALRALVFPLQKLAKRGAAMAVAGLLLSREFGEGLADLGEVEEWIVAEAVAAARRAQNETFGAAVKRRQRVSIAGHRDHADEAGGALLVGNIVKFAQQARIVGLVGGIGCVLRY